MSFKFVGVDFWGRNLYQSMKTKRVYAEVDKMLYSITEEGEPDDPLCPLEQIIIEKEEDENAS